MKRYSILVMNVVTKLSLDIVFRQTYFMSAYELLVTVVITKRIVLIFFK